MTVHQIFAQIFEEEVKNIIVCENYEFANQLSRAAYGNDAIAVDCLQCPCKIGDKYREGTFYSISEDGEETLVKRIPTAEEEVQALSARIEYLSMMSGIEMEAGHE